MEKLHNWTSAHPNLATILHELWRCQVRVGIFSGFHAFMYGVRPHTNDVDLFTHSDDFAVLPYFFPDGEIYHNKRVTMHDASGEQIRFIADEFLAVIDGVEVQALRPRSPVVIGSSLYDLSMTDFSALNITPVEAGSAVVGMAHLLDTIAAKALFQRDRGKSDFADVSGLAVYCNTNHDRVYFSQRAEEIGFTEREFAFLGQAGLNLSSLQYQCVAA